MATGCDPSFLRCVFQPTVDNPCFGNPRAVAAFRPQNNPSYRLTLISILVEGRHKAHPEGFSGGSWPWMKFGLGVAQRLGTAAAKPHAQTIPGTPENRSGCALPSTACNMGIYAVPFCGSYTGRARAPSVDSRKTVYPPAIEMHSAKSSFSQNLDLSLLAVSLFSGGNPVWPRPPQRGLPVFCHGGLSRPRAGSIPHYGVHARNSMIDTSTLTPR